jgi:hypothetical protein
MSASRQRPNTLSAIKKDDYTWFRRQHLQFLGEAGIKLFEDRVLERIQAFTDMLGMRESKDTIPDEKGDEWSSTKEIDEMSKWLMFDIVSDLCFGETANLLQSPKNRSYLNGISAQGRVGHLVSRPACVRPGIHLLTMCGQGMAQPLIGRWKLGKWFLAPSWSDVKATAVWVSNASKARVARVEDKARPDMFSAFLNAKHPKTGQVFDRKHLFAESMLFMGAGTSLLKSHLTYRPPKPS